jgi:hypothetical protein
MDLKLLFVLLRELARGHAKRPQAEFLCLVLFPDLRFLCMSADIQVALAWKREKFLL